MATVDNVSERRKKAEFGPLCDAQSDAIQRLLRRKVPAQDMWPSGRLNLQGLCQATAAERDSTWEVTHSLILIDAYV